MNNDRIGGWIETFSGVSFYPLDPNINEINIEDIAHSLSYQCRFNGHSNGFYSVAHHCLLVTSDLFSRGFGYREQLKGLLHDASEAYLCDIPSPVKPYLKGYLEIEDKLQNMIYEKYEVLDVDYKPIHESDKRLLGYEADVFMKCVNWKPNFQNDNPYRIDLENSMEPHQSKQAFLETFYILKRLIAYDN